MFRQLDIRGDLANLEELPDIEHQPLARFNLTQKKTNEEKPNKKTLKAKTKTVPVKRTNEDFINNEYNGEEPEEEVVLRRSERATKRPRKLLAFSLTEDLMSEDEVEEDLNTSKTIPSHLADQEDKEVDDDIINF